MESDISQAFQEELTCFICLSCLTEPVTISCGHSFCRASAEDEMERLLKQMASLWEKIQEIEETIEANMGTKTLWMDYVTLREEMIRTEYRELHPFLCEEEEKHIECMRKEGQCVLDKLRKSEAMIVQKSKDLREMFQELMAMSQEPYVVLLQGLDDMVRRSESMQLNMPEVMEPELSALPITGLTESCKQFQVHIFFDNVTTSHSMMNLFNGLREFSSGPHLEDTSADSVGCYLACWASLEFISGKYYWEMDLQESGDWAVGVCEDSWLRNTNQMIDSEGAFLLVCMKEGNHYCLLTTCPLFWHYIERPLGRVGVLLDCDRGCLSFVNVAKSSLIYRCPPGIFKNPVRPFFSSSHEGRTFNPAH
nr:tripartite motif-containing protein 43-like [Peromyscus maniculatus bairdii]